MFTRRVLSYHRIATSVIIIAVVGVRVDVENRKLTATSWLHIIVLQVLIHYCCISALSQLASFLNAAVSKYALCHSHITRAHLFCFGFPWHLKLLQCRLGKLLFNLFFKVDEFGFYFWIDVSLAL